LSKTVLITGGAGFIGCNTAQHFAEDGEDIIIFDNLSRKGTSLNLKWLQEHYKITFIKGDVRNYADIKDVFVKYPKIDVVLHFAGQVAVTTSVVNPREDFEINALGTFNLLEAMRETKSEAILIDASTNKVYGGMEDIEVVERNGRYEYRDIQNGIPETRLLDFHSPYGCCYSEDTDILTRKGWKKFYELTPDDDVLTYNLERKVAEFQRPTAHFAFPYEGKMYVQTNRRLKTCVTPNHKMLVAWDCNHNELERPRLVEAQLIEGKPMAYLLAAEVEGGQECEQFVLPEVKAGKHKHHFPAKAIPMCDWLRFLGWYLSEGHCYEHEETSNCTVTLTTYYRTDEAVAVMRAIGLSPAVNKHHVTATSRQLYEYVRLLGKSHEKYIPQCIKDLSRKHLIVLLKSLLDGDGNSHSKDGWRYTTVSKRLADDVQEIAIKCGMAASVSLDKDGFYRVYISTTRTAHCNLDENKSEWVDYTGMVYCVEVPNSVVLVRQNGYAYFSGNSKGTADQYVRDYARIYGLKTVVFRQSCIQGYRQFGIEDQGWVAWFTIATAFDKPITIYGDGKQVRDVLFIDDLVRAYKMCIEKIDITKGNIYNIGGGPRNTMSLLELIAYLEEFSGKKIRYSFSSWRPGDQPVFVCDISKAKRDFGWEPQISVKEGVAKLFRWVQENKNIFKEAGVI